MGKYRKAGCWVKCCEECGERMEFRYYCHARTRKFCSQPCRDRFRSEHSVQNQFGVRKAWTKQEDHLLLDEFQRGVSLEQIAELLNRTPWQVKGRVAKLGLVRSADVLSHLYAEGGKKNKGRKRPDLAKNAFRGSGKLNPFYGRTHSEEARRVISEKAKKAGTFKKKAKDPEFQKRRMMGLHARPNKPETIVNKLLHKMFPGEYRYTGDGSFIVDGLNPDFVNVNGQKKIIEVFGETYHDPSVAPRPVSYRSTEAGRKEALVQFGYRTLIIWSKEIFLGGKQGRKKLRQKIREFHEDMCD